MDSSDFNLSGKCVDHVLCYQDYGWTCKHHTEAARICTASSFIMLGALETAHGSMLPLAAARSILLVILKFTIQ